GSQLISTYEALLAALLVLFPGGSDEAYRGTVYAELRGDYYQVTYIGHVRYTIPGQPPVIEAHWTQVDARTGSVKPFSVTMKPSLEGMAQPESYSAWSDETLSIKNAYEKAYLAVKDYE